MAKKVPPSVRAGLKKAVRGELRDPQVAELVAHFFTAAGGTKAVALLLYQEFTAARPGSITRQRILDMILRGVRFANEKQGVRDDLGLLAEEDLARELEDVIGGLPDDDAAGQAGQPARPA